jgi:phosphate transport system protein
MVEKFHVEVKGLREDVLRMGFLAQDMLAKSMEALIQQDPALAAWVLSKKGTIAEYDEKIEQESLRLIALYQPMASDMRTIACALKMNTYLTRIGRYSKDIAVLVDELSDKPHIANLMSIPAMSGMVVRMIGNSLKAFETWDLSYISNLKSMDDEVDALRYSVFRECVTYMMEDPKTITRCTNYVMIARYLERCGDHACKMGEKIHYMVTGERIEIK